MAWFTFFALQRYENNLTFRHLFLRFARKRRIIAVKYCKNRQMRASPLPKSACVATLSWVWGRPRQGKSHGTAHFRSPSFADVTPPCGYAPVRIFPIASASSLTNPVLAPAYLQWKKYFPPVEKIFSSRGKKPRLPWGGHFPPRPWIEMTVDVRNFHDEAIKKGKRRLSIPKGRFPENGLGYLGSNQD